MKKERKKKRRRIIAKAQQEKGNMRYYIKKKIGTEKTGICRKRERKIERKKRNKK